MLKRYKKGEGQVEEATEERGPCFRGIVGGGTYRNYDIIKWYRQREGRF